MRLARFILVLVPGLLTGCFIPRPHTTLRSQEISGKVLDERTHAPIQGAKIYLTEQPNVSCVSRPDGTYKLKAIYNWHTGYISGGAESFDVPAGKYWRPIITLSHTNYIQREVDWGRFHPDVILLKRSGEPATIRPWLTFNGSGEIMEDTGAARYLKPGNIQIVERYRDPGFQRPYILRIGFVQRVYDPQITAMDNFDKAQIDVSGREGFDWKFRITYWLWTGNVNVKDASRVYRLEFIPYAGS